MKFEEITPGMFRELTHTIVPADIEKFVQLTGDDNALHLDPAFARKTSMGKPVAHGMLGASFISTIIGTQLPGDGALWFGQSLEFLMPVHVGDTITVRAEVLKKDDRNRNIELKTTIRNQFNELVTSGVARVRVLEQTKTEPETVKGTDRPPGTALVVGGSGGIGSASCIALAKAGYEVVVHYHSNREAAEKVVSSILAEGGRAFSIAADITDKSSVFGMVARIAERTHPVSIVVNCATARIANVDLDALSWDDFEIHLNNQIRGSLNLVQAVVPAMTQAGYGKIVQINSQALETPSSGWLPYITAKGALMGFARALAFDLAPLGIRVNSIAPGMTETELISGVPERVRLLAAARTPVKRLARPDDVANAVVFLAAAQSDFLCGETIRVNGGQVMF